MGRMKLPRAILFDLDDTILVAFGPAQSQWQRTIGAFADQLGPIEATVIAAAIEAASTELWADPGRHKYWRHRTGAARRQIVATAFAALAATGDPVPPEAVGDALADAYNALHDEELSLFPDAHETLDRLKELGVKLALITNGAAEPQRAQYLGLGACPSNVCKDAILKFYCPIWGSGDAILSIVPVQVAHSFVLAITRTGS